MDLAVPDLREQTTFSEFLIHTLFKKRKDKVASTFASYM